MTLIDRAALADALASATVETLREDAAFIANAQTLLGNNDERFARLAALALAVAAMQERGAFLDGGVMPWTLAVGAPGASDDVVTNAPTLMSALAALIKGDQ